MVLCWHVLIKRDVSTPHGLQSFTTQDLGVVEILRRVAPNLPVHGSTQMTITSPEGADFVAGLGVDRVVVGRELSVREIAKV